MRNILLSVKQSSTGEQLQISRMTMKRTYLPCNVVHYPHFPHLFYLPSPSHASILSSSFSSLIRVVKADRLMSIKSISEAIPGLLAYSERHFSRVDRCVTVLSSIPPTGSALFCCLFTLFSCHSLHQLPTSPHLEYLYPFFKFL